MGYLELLAESAQQRQSIVCFGLDPVLEEMPIFEAQNPEEKIVKFFTSIVDASLSQTPSISAIKPNYAYFAQYGFDGLRAMKRIIDNYRGKLPVILDAKRGDIGRSSEAYAREAFDFWGADSVTVSPYMGQDSLNPFLSRCKVGGKGVYVLCRTSNPGSADFQSLVLESNRQLFLEVARKIDQWHVPGVGLVMGATALDEIEGAMWTYYDSAKPVPFLVPGVGAQGASAQMTAQALKSVWSAVFPLHRINSSSGIAYAFKREGVDDYVGAALREIARLNAQIGKI